MNRLRAIIFDFNGIILDDEPFHFRSMSTAVSSLGIDITKEQYWSRYLPFDDFRCLEAICSDHGVTLSEAERSETLRKKSELYQRMIREQYPLFPGVRTFIQAAAERYPLVIASGARRKEIGETLRNTGLDANFKLFVGAEDFTQGKPHPESYLLALDRLNGLLDHTAPAIHPRECLVIEDSIGGVRGSRDAGMVCLAVSNSYPPDQLREAHLVVGTLEGLRLLDLEQLFGDPR